MASCNNIMFLITLILVFVVCRKMHITALSLVDHQSAESPRLSRSVAASKEKKTIEGSNPKHVVCYFASWAANRPDKGKFTPEDIDPKLCTHINYAYASLSSETLTIVPAYPVLDRDQKFYERVINIKKENKMLKVLLSLGVWFESKDDKYSRMITDSRSRKNFIKEAVLYLKKYQFDGLDLDWRYPACPQGNCSIGNPKDREHFSLFVKELRTDFENTSPPLLLTIMLAGTTYFAERAYAVADLAEYVDFFNVIGFFMHGPLENATGHASEFYGHSANNTDDHTVVSSLMEYYVRQGAPREKLIMGIPLFGTSFTLQDPRNNSIGAPVIGDGISSPNAEQGILDYFEICDLIKNHDWTVRRDPKAGPYAFHGDQWVGYDDPVSAKEKASFVLKEGYGGVMVWDLTMDDFRGECGPTKFPVVRTLKMVMQADVSDERGKSSSSIFDTGMGSLIWTVAFVLFQERKNLFSNFN